MPQTGIGMDPDMEAQAVKFLRYRMYYVILGGAIVTYLSNIIFGFLLGTHPFELISRSGMVIALGFLLWQVAKQKRINRRLETIGYFLFVTDISLKFQYYLATYNDLSFILLDLGIWFLVMNAFTFFIFEPNQGVLSAVAINLGSMAISIPTIIARGLINLENMSILYEFYAASFFVIIFGYAAAVWKESYEQARRNALIAEQNSITDSLTNIYNRRGLEIIYERESARAERYNRDLSIILFDIDNFKHINDSFGHATGDLVLTNMADVVQSKLRKGDEVGRWGGEEFMVICSESNLEQAHLVAERLREAIENSDWIGMNITASFGVSQLELGDTLMSLYKRADKALYQAKHEGKNCCRVAFSKPYELQLNESKSSV